MVRVKTSRVRRVVVVGASLHLTAYACAEPAFEQPARGDESLPSAGGSGGRGRPQGVAGDETAGFAGALVNEGEGGRSAFAAHRPRPAAPGAGGSSAGPDPVGGEAGSEPFAGGGGVGDAGAGSGGLEEPSEQGGAFGTGGDGAESVGGEGGESRGGDGGVGAAGRVERGDGGAGGSMHPPVAGRGGASSSTGGSQGRGGSAGSPASAGGAGSGGSSAGAVGLAGSGGKATGGPLPKGDVANGALLVADYNCAGCHGADLAGRSYFRNITPDVVTGIGAWSDDEIARGIRNGKNQTGQTLCHHMPHYPWPDQKVADVIAYLRTVPPKFNLINSVCPGHGS